MSAGSIFFMNAAARFGRGVTKRRWWTAKRTFSHVTDTSSSIPFGPAWSHHRGIIAGRATAPTPTGRTIPLSLRIPPFLGLAACGEERHDLYRRLFGEAIAEDALQEIRDATQFEWVLGSDSFKRRTAKLTGRRAE